MKTKYISFTDVRKVEFLEKELGESAMVTGQGLLGIFATRFLRQSAAFPLIAAKRIQVLPIVSRAESPKNAAEIYNQLCDDKDFPMGTV